MLRRLREEGLVRPGARLEVGKLWTTWRPSACPPGTSGSASAGTGCKGQFARVNDPRNPDFAVALQLTIPAEQLFTHRVWLGMVGVLAQLGAEVPVRPELRRWLPGFEL